MILIFWFVLKTLKMIHISNTHAVRACGCLDGKVVCVAGSTICALVIFSYHCVYLIFSINGIDSLLVLGPDSNPQPAEEWAYPT